MRHCWIYLSAALILVLSAVHASAAGFSDEAQELTAQAVIECTNSKVITDGDETTYTKIADGSSVVITSNVGISSLYIIFDRIYGQWTLSDGITDTVCGKNGFLHEYVDALELFGYSPTSLTLTFSGHDCSLSELHLFGDGEIPDWVQRWEPPCKEADLMLTSTHIDDEQLFFAGILPYYAGERGLAVQVVYFTDPFTYHERPHEQLNGLWTVGVRNYPVAGEYKDAYSETAEDAYAHQKQYGYEREDMVLFQVEMIRRFRPHVVVGHDINGEYSHGQHIINCETLMEALDLAADPSYAPDSALSYGVWDTPKAYIHLWEENPIIMDWDEPLEAFGGKTAFQVSQEGFLCHKSQQWTWFRRWIFGRNNEITEASQIKTYSPCLYGLYRTNVGLDIDGGDMFENIPQSYADIRAEEMRRLEEALAAAEEEASQEAGTDVPELSDSGQTELMKETDSDEDLPFGAPGTELVEAENGKGSYIGIIVAVATVTAALAALVISYLLLKKRERNYCKKMAGELSTCPGADCYASDKPSPDPEQVEHNFTLIIPSLNPDEKLSQTVLSALAAGIDDIILVDDGSSSCSRHYFTELETSLPEDTGLPQVTLLTHEKNLGKGAALKTAFAYYLKNRMGRDGVVTADGDGQHRIEDIIACAREMTRGENAVVLGCRNFELANVPAKSRFGNRLTSLVFRLFFGMSLSDTQTGLRAIPTRYIRALMEAKGTRYEYETNMLLLMGQRHIPYREVQIETLYFDDNNASHFRPIRDSIRVYGLILKYLANSLASSVVDLFMFYLLGQFVFTGGGRLEVLLSTAGARVISSVVNFAMNRQFVFESRSGMARTFIRYVCLAVPVMLVSWLTVYGLSALAGTGIGQLGRTLLKVPVDTVLFLISFRVQRRWVFAEEQQSGGGLHEGE